VVAQVYQEVGIFILILKEAKLAAAAPVLLYSERMVILLRLSDNYMVRVLMETKPADMRMLTALLQEHFQGFAGF
jgi:hypothetical protein